MDLIEEFGRAIGVYLPYDFTYDFRYKEDLSEFTVIDGEEGDYGIIKFYSLCGKLLAVREVFGGDDSDIEFTQYAKELFEPIIISAVKFKIENL
jgi:hypothetical protein